MAFLDDGLSALIGRLYDASVDNAQWTGIAPTIAEAFGSDSAVLKFHSDADVRLLECTHNLRVPDARQDWASHWHQNDLWVERAVARSVSTVFTDRDLVTPREQAESGFYQEWLRELDIFHVIGTLFPVDEGTLGVLGVHRPKRNRPFSRADRRKAAFLLPHLQRAFHLSQSLSTIRHAATLEALNRLDTAVLVANQSCLVLYANAMAERVMDIAQEFSVRAGQLRLGDSALQERLLKLIQTAIQTAADRPAPLGMGLVIPRVGRLPLTLTVTPLRPTGLIQIAMPLALILLRDPEYPTASVETLRDLFGLTPTESTIAADLGIGLSLEQIAARRGIGLSTVRSHLKRILSKTGTNRQVEAAVLVARSVAPLHALPRSVSPK